MRPEGLPVSRWLPILLGCLTAVGSLSVDIYLPAFPAIEASYRAPAGSAQLTLAAFFAGLAVGQLAQGTLADRFGRRLPLLAGLVVYTIASAGCALSPNIATLSAMRALAAFGASAGMVIPRAVVRDLADGPAAARLMSQLMLVMGVAPIVAPTLGGVLLNIGAWPLIFWADALYGLACVALIWFWLPETLPPQRRARLGFAGLAVRYIGVLQDRGFLAFALLGGSAMFGLYAFIAGSPPVFIGHYHLGPAAYGVLFGLSAAGFITGSQANYHVVRRFGAPRVLRAAVRLYLAATLALAGFAWVGGFGVATVVFPVMVSMFCLGCVSPNAAVGALSKHASQAGSASAMMGTIQFVLAAISGSAIGWLTDGTARPMATLMVAGAACAVLADLFRPALKQQSP